MTDYVPLTDHKVSRISNESLKAEGRGTVELVSTVNKQQVTCKLKNVLYVPRASNNLLSIMRLDREGGHAIMGNGVVTLKVRGGCTIAKGKLQNGLYLLNSWAKLHPITKIYTTRDEKPVDWLTWH
ncbi:hypothetical protein DEU56DRAFT_746773, partial [Suillus clintonianus]|uniref:uncharacterized protein n=1 Tax=Suillus clintonianus TaxID=1904413 RepID=UPI001B86672E